MVILVERAGHLVEKEELISALWPDSFVEEANVAQHVWTIRKALGDAHNGRPFIETVPKKGFRFAAPVVRRSRRDEESPVGADVGTLPTSTLTRGSSAEHLVKPVKGHWNRVVVAVGLLLILTFALLGLYGLKSRSPAKSRATLKIVPFTSFPGQKSAPAFSPDGKQIAFVWDGPKGDNEDIYVKLISEGNPLRLTSDPAPDRNPSWSPDGRFIAFVRVLKDENVLMTMPLGGPERKVITFTGNPFANWSPDGKYFVINSKDSSDELTNIYLVSVETGEKRKLTSSPSQFNGDRGGRFSPDGRWIAFIRSLNISVDDIYVVPVSGGEPRRITNDNVEMRGLDWTADGREIVFSSNRGGPFSLWRVLAAGGAPEPLPGVGENATVPRISRQGNYIAYVSDKLDYKIWRGPGPNAPDKNSPLTQLIASTRKDAQPQYSPDGKRIAFVSDRSGSWEIWICDSEGSNPIQLTHLGSGDNGSPHWSPNGQQIAFDARITGSSDIYIINVDGGSPRQLTTEPSTENVPIWSKDGRWIFFGSDRSGDWQIWKIPAAGGQSIQVTKGGGFLPVGTTHDFIYHVRSSGALIPGKKSGEPGVWRVPVDGGDEIHIFDQVEDPATVFVSEDGIYFVKQPVVGQPDATLAARGLSSMSKLDREIEFYSFIDKQTMKLFSVKKPAVLWGLSASPDGNWILYTESDRLDNDIMLVENFQ